MARRLFAATHEWVVGGSVLATVNEPPDTGYPRADIVPSKGVGGWDSLPDADSPEADAPVGMLGERPSPRTSRGKTLSYNLVVQTDLAGGQAELEDFLATLRGAFADRSSIGQIVNTPWAGDEIWATYAQVLDFDADGLISRSPFAVPSPWQRDPILSFRQIDGRWYWWNESGTPGDPMVFTDGDAAVTVTNSGKAPTDPVISVAGVVLHDDIHIGRDAVGGYPEQSLWFRDLPAGTLVVDFAARTAKVGATDVTDKLDEDDSDWWDPGVFGVPPGSFNVWRGPGAGGAITVSFFSASW